MIQKIPKNINPQISLNPTHTCSPTPPILTDSIHKKNPSHHYFRKNTNTKPQKIKNYFQDHQQRSNTVNFYRKIKDAILRLLGVGDGEEGFGGHDEKQTEIEVNQRNKMKIDKNEIQNKQNPKKITNQSVKIYNPFSPKIIPPPTPQNRLQQKQNLYLSQVLIKLSHQKFNLHFLGNKEKISIYLDIVNSLGLIKKRLAMDIGIKGGNEYEGLMKDIDRLNSIIEKEETVLRSKKNPNNNSPTNNENNQRQELIKDRTQSIGLTRPSTSHAQSLSNSSAFMLNYINARHYNNNKGHHHEKFYSQVEHTYHQHEKDIKNRMNNGQQGSTVGDWNAISRSKSRKLNSGELKCQKAKFFRVQDRAEMTKSHRERSKENKIMDQQNKIRRKSAVINKEMTKTLIKSSLKVRRTSSNLERSQQNTLKTISSKQRTVKIRFTAEINQKQKGVKIGSTEKSIAKNLIDTQKSIKMVSFSQISVSFKKIRSRTYIKDGKQTKRSAKSIKSIKYDSPSKKTIESSQLKKSRLIKGSRRNARNMHEGFVSKKFVGGTIGTIKIPDDNEIMEGESYKIFVIQPLENQQESSQLKRVQSQFDSQQILQIPSNNTLCISGRNQSRQSSLTSGSIKSSKTLDPTISQKNIRTRNPTKSPYLKRNAIFYQQGQLMLARPSPRNPSRPPQPPISASPSPYRQLLQLNHSLTSQAQPYPSVLFKQQEDLQKIIQRNRNTDFQESSLKSGKGAIGGMEELALSVMACAGDYPILCEKEVRGSGNVSNGNDMRYYQRCYSFLADREWIRRRQYGTDGVGLLQKDM